ncbi:hypothetical protein MMC11_000212 [Xylographa trunciseda]|nr:hypothetical protein [Xylographa trunciseda]
MPQIKPYRIAIPKEKVDRLKQKLALADFPTELEGAEWEYGTPLADVKRLTEYWHKNFDWSKAEAKLNELPHFSTDISVDNFETLNIHFVHQKSEVKAAVPLLFAHGWPGSFHEVVKILPELVQGSEDFPAFHVVAPSLPSFGFSEGTKKKGFTTRQHAEVCHKLMLALGYDQYVTQGGDIGYGVTRGLAYLYPESCKATHTNFPRPNPPTLKQHPALYFEYLQSTLSEMEKSGTARTKWFLDDGFGYNAEQSTKPQTIGYSMTDSPVGLLSWILEKLHDWTDSYPWTDDEILTWISIYAFSTAGPAASQRIYYESKHDKDKFGDKLAEYIPDVKLGVAKFPKEILQHPKLWNQTLGPLVFESEYTKGGHFAAWERPDAIVHDLRTMFGKEGGAYGVVKGKTGFE